MTTPMDQTGIKARWDLAPWNALAWVVRVLTEGAAKHGAEGWRQLGAEEVRRLYFAALMRHLVAWWTGQRLDPESKLPHLAHACANVLVLLDDELSREAGAPRVVNVEPLRVSVAPSGLDSERLAEILRTAADTARAARDADVEARNAAARNVAERIDEALKAQADRYEKLIQEIRERTGDEAARARKRWTDERDGLVKEIAELKRKVPIATFPVTDLGLVGRIYEQLPDEVPLSLRVRSGMTNADALTTFEKFVEVVTRTPRPSWTGRRRVWFVFEILDHELEPVTAAFQRFASESQISDDKILDSKVQHYEEINTVEFGLTLKPGGLKPHVFANPAFDAWRDLVNTLASAGYFTTPRNPQRPAPDPTPTEISKVATVNEVRAEVGLAPLADPVGNKPVAAVNYDEIAFAAVEAKPEVKS